MDSPAWEIALSFKMILTTPACPPRWKRYDLYLFRDDQVVFYVGQSYCAFERVWEHIHGGPKGHSIIGRFALANWPVSARFTVELLDSRGPRFDQVYHNLDAAERALIEQYAPCFNMALNRQPTPLPAGYLPPSAPIKYLRSYKRMLREASYVRRASEKDTEWE